MSMLAVDQIPDHIRMRKPDAMPRRVLLADDDDDTRRLLAAMLRAGDYEVQEAVDGAELLSQLEASARGARQFGAVIADHRMPYMLGVDVLAALAAERWRLPFIVMSGHVDDDLRTEARKLGAAAVLGKPVSLPAIRRAVASAMGSASC